MAAPTNAAFLTEKRANFVKFCREALMKRKSNARYVKFCAKLSELEALNVDVFTAAIVETMVPYKDDPAQYIIKTLSEQEISRDDLTPEELAKCARYISCFIDVISC